MVCFFLQRHPTGLRECWDPHNRSCHEIEDTGDPQHRIHIHSDVSLMIFFSHVCPQDGQRSSAHPRSPECVSGTILIAQGSAAKKTTPFSIIIKTQNYIHKRELNTEKYVGFDNCCFCCALTNFKKIFGCIPLALLWLLIRCQIQKHSHTAPRELNAVAVGVCFDSCFNIGTTVNNLIQPTLPLSNSLTRQMAFQAPDLTFREW